MLAGQIIPILQLNGVANKMEDIKMVQNDTKEKFETPQQLDITAPMIVQVEYDSNRKVLYVHVDGYTALRICRITDIEFVNCSAVQQYLRDSQK